METKSINDFSGSHLKNFITKLFLFKDCSNDCIDSLIKRLETEIRDFQPGEEIYTPDMFEKRIGFLMDGECVVERQKNDGGSIPLNVLKKYDCFGIISIFSKNKKFPTLIKAIKNTRIMFIESESFKDAVKENSSIAFALMAFMSERIEFLNSKIATFSADSVEDKFAIFLLSESKRLNSSEFALNLSKTAKILNSGRASVYRAIDSLEKSSLIKFENKKIILLDPKGLERNLK